MSKLSINKFTKTIKIDANVAYSLFKKAITLQPGQWVETEDGLKGRFVGVDGRNIHIDFQRKGDQFFPMTMRFSRAVRHEKMNAGYRNQKPRVAHITAPAYTIFERVAA